ncbi:hypothetical protein LX64_00696 [Chitinophaga skermanii]|uniref:Uncharacterized protein n=1 Tax=Chitinophaga skermanii TaxID=331697 RepID=A0A327R4T5_9BACT|nr:hypothetical protein [Chitinophaga skermanii]RAJ11088.1 hypothetical protein LX64_00696 [Chitinophaga skermanii]
MHKELLKKMEQYKKLAAKGTAIPMPTVSNTVKREDNLSKVIRTKMDADIFMNEVKFLVSIANK